jgi:hypothetical protein
MHMHEGWPASLEALEIVRQQETLKDERELNRYSQTPWGLSVD